MSGNIEVLTDNYGVEDGANVWSNNILATDTVVLANGAFARKGSGTAGGAVSPDALVALRALAGEAESLAGGISVGMGSEGSEGFEAFACHLGTPLRQVDERAVRAVFGDALYAGASVTIEALAKGTKWWQQVVEDSDGDEGLLARWGDLIAWFQHPERFAATGYVAIDAQPPADSFAGDVSGGCVFPRLLLGIHPNGGLAGLLGVVVYT